MYAQSVRVDEWAQGGMRSMVHGGIGFTHLKPKGKTSQDKDGKSPERFSVATYAPVGWASSWRWRAGNHGACPHAWGPCTVPIAGIVKSGPPDVELQGGSSIVVSKDRLDDELLLIVLSYSQQILCGWDRWWTWMCAVIWLPDTKSSIV